MAKKKVSVNLSDIDSLITALKTYKEDITKVCDEISKEIANDGLKNLQKEYGKLYSDPNLEDIDTKVDKNDKGYTLAAYGKDVLYAEFGSGDEGENNPHENKLSSYGLNNYNSGEYIRDVSSLSKKAQQKVAKHGISSGKYWTYEKDGSIQYTQGVPAGMQMYNTVNYIHKNYDKIVKKKVGEINDKFINSIKK